MDVQTSETGFMSLTLSESRPKTDIAQKKRCV